MTVADAAIVLVIVLSVVVAASHGFLFQAISLAGTVVGYLLASWEYFRVAPWFAQYVRAQWLANVAGFLVIFLAVVLVAGIAARVARWAAKEVGLRWFDRILGAAFGLLRGMLLVSVTILALVTFAPGSRVLAGSLLAPYFLVVAKAAIWLAPSDVRSQFNQGADMLRGLTPPGSSNSGRR